MKFQDVFKYTGNNGLYHMLLFFLANLSSIFNGFHNMSSNFFAAPMDHWCQVPRLENLSYETQRYVAIPYEDGDSEKYDSCSMFNIDYDSLSDEDILMWNRTSLGNISTIDTKDCSDWVFDQSQFISTIGSKYRLVCGKAFLAELTSTIFMAGIFVGSLISGIISDSIGRKWTLFVSQMLYIVFGTVQGFAPNYAAFVVFRFLTAVCNITGSLSGIVLMSEILGPKHYVKMMALGHGFFSTGFLLVPWISYALRDMQHLFIAISVPLVCSIPFIWAIPESPRWLCSKGRYKEAEKILRNIAKVNNRSFPENVKWEEDSAVSKKAKASDISKSNILCSRLALVYLNWFTCSLVYYGVSFNAGAFGDVFQNTFLSGLIEYPAVILVWVCLEKGGRKWSNSGSLLLTGVFCLACVPVIIVRPDLKGLLTALSTLGKGAIKFAFCCVYVHGAEMFPTHVRHLAIGTASMFGRIGSMASPFLGRVLQDVWEPLPSIIFGGLSVFTGLVVILLPETKGHPPPDTVEAAENLSKKKPKLEIITQIDVNLVDSGAGSFDVSNDNRGISKGDVNVDAYTKIIDEIYKRDLESEKHPEIDVMDSTRL